MGLNIHTQDPEMVELAKGAGFDFVLPTIHKRNTGVVRAAVAAQIPHLVRLEDIDSAHLDPDLIGKALDLGVDGLQFMLVSSRKQAENIVRLCRRPSQPVIQGDEYSSHVSTGEKQFQKEATVVKDHGHTIARHDTLRPQKGVGFQHSVVELNIVQNQMAILQGQAFGFQISPFPNPTRDVHDPVPMYFCKAAE